MTTGPADVPAWPPCARTPEYQAWAAEQLAAAPPLTDDQKRAIAAAVIHDREQRRAS